LEEVLRTAVWVVMEPAPPGANACRAAVLAEDCEGQRITDKTDRTSAFERHREPYLVVDALPVAQRELGGGECFEAGAAPEFLGIDPVAPLDLAVLSQPSRGPIPKEILHRAVEVAMSLRYHAEKAPGSGRAYARKEPTAIEL